MVMMTARKETQSPCNSSPCYQDLSRRTAAAIGAGHLANVGSYAGLTGFNSRQHKALQRDELPCAGLCSRCKVFSSLQYAWSKQAHTVILVAVFATVPPSSATFDCSQTNTPTFEHRTVIHTCHRLICIAHFPIIFSNTIWQFFHPALITKNNA